MNLINIVNSGKMVFKAFQIRAVQRVADHAVQCDETPTSASSKSPSG